MTRVGAGLISLVSELKPTLISRLNLLKFFLTKVGHGVLSCREGVDRVATHGAQGPPVTEGLRRRP